MNRSLALSLLLGGSFALVAQEKRPNIIMLYIDDMGYSDLSCYGGKYAQTPNIDRIAEEGIRFTQYYSACPISSPSRVGLTTGMYPIRWGISTYLQSRKANKANEQNDFLDVRAPSMARMLKEAGYTTGHFGKWHMGGGRDVDNAPSILTYGFDEYASTWESPDPDPLLTDSNWVWSNTDSIKRWNRSAYFVDKTLDFLKRNNGKPCFVNLWPDDVHTPWVRNTGGRASDQSEWLEPKSFSTVLKELDVQIGRLMQGLKKLGIDDNTLIIVASDNGPNPSFKNGRTAGLRGQKGSLYEGGIRMPLIVRWNNHIVPRQINDESVMSAVDILPSICKITGANLPTDYSIDGEDRSSIMLGGKNSERNAPVFWEFGKNISDVKVQSNTSRSPQIAVREGDWKLLVNIDGSRLELYNMKMDKFEKINVAGKNPSIAKELKIKAIDWFNRSFREFVK